MSITYLIFYLFGVTARESIVALDDDIRRLAYAVIDRGRMPLKHHPATFQVFPEGENQSRLVWTTDFLPHTFETEIRARMER